MVQTRIIWNISSPSYVLLVGGCFDCLETLKSDSTEVLYVACKILSFEQSVQPHIPFFSTVTTQPANTTFLSYHTLHHPQAFPALKTLL